MYIPDEMLPKITVGGDGRPRLPSKPNLREVKHMGHEDKARHYLEEALDKLALAKFYADKPTYEEWAVADPAVW